MKIVRTFPVTLCESKGGFFGMTLSVLTLINSLGDYDIEYDDDGVVNLTCENFVQKT